jgi:hypothetical protein
MLERRHESRVRVQLSVQIFGVDGNGKRFAKSVPATNISRSGALLSDVDVTLRCGDYLAIKYNDQRANFRIVWLGNSDKIGHLRIAVHKVENQRCPWEEALSEGDMRPQSVLETSAAELDQALRENWGMDFTESPIPMWVFDRKSLAFRQPDRNCRLWLLAGGISGDDHPRHSAQRRCPGRAGGSTCTSHRKWCARMLEASPERWCRGGCCLERATYDPGRTSRRADCHTPDGRRDCRRHAVGLCSASDSGTCNFARGTSALKFAAGHTASARHLEEVTQRADIRHRIR